MSKPENVKRLRHDITQLYNGYARTYERVQSLIIQYQASIDEFGDDSEVSRQLLVILYQDNLNRLAHIRRLRSLLERMDGLPEEPQI